MRLKFVIALAFTLVSLAFAHAAMPQDLLAVRTPLQVVPQGNLSGAWKVHDAGFGENLTATSGYLDVENISDVSVEGAIFYAEYFDASGRFCFSLLFSLAKNVGVRGPVSPREVRELSSVGIGLAASSEPKEVRLYLVQQHKAASTNSSCTWNVPIRAPITVGGSVPADAAKLQLGADVDLGQAPVVDLLLAKVGVDKEGLVDQVDVLNAANKQLDLWFRNFARQLTIFPETECDVPKRSEALILVRAVLTDTAPSDSPYLPRKSQWVELYGRNHADSEAPMVTEVFFSRPPSRVKLGESKEFTDLPPTPPNILQAMTVGSEWSPSAVNWVRDQSMPHHLRRELVP